jgi:D-tyrosyl-tRNA(Tyr) deacylase
MRAVIQRVSEASVTIEEKSFNTIEKGLLVLLGLEEADTKDDAAWLTNKIAQMRIFSDENNKMNLNLGDIHGELLIISQFTLHASTKKGNRPSFIKAAKPDQAIALYEYFIQEAKNLIGPNRVKTGQFGSDMKVALVNDGPITIFIDSKNKE